MYTCVNACMDRWRWIWSSPLYHPPLPSKDQQAYTIINVCIFEYNLERDGDRHDEWGVYTIFVSI